MPHAPLQTFIIYARADEAHKKELLKHLNSSLIEYGHLSVWEDSKLLPGEDWEKSIKKYLKQSDLILVLVSADALSSEFIRGEELRMAFEQHAASRSTIVPIIVRSCKWDLHPILPNLQGLPKNMKPVKSYSDPDEAWTEVVEGLERILLEIIEKSESPEIKPPVSAPPPHPPNLTDLAEEAAWKMAARLDVEAVYEFKLPSLGDGVTGKVLEILVKPGDTVTKDQIVLIVGTDKVDAEMPVDANGVVEEILVRKGDDVTEGSVILRMKANATASHTPLAGSERVVSTMPSSALATAPVLLTATGPAEEATWKMALRLNVEAAYHHYLEDFPTGKYAAEAKKRIVALTAKVITPKLEISEPQPLIRDCPDCPEMVFVKGGTFMMGSEDGEDNEKPVHQVTLSDFYIGKYPVTFEEYDRFCEATKRKRQNDQGWGRGRNPVINVSWDNADDYCDWLSEKTGKKYRLPTEAEWEFAARGGIKSKGRKFSGSNDLDEVGWFSENANNITHPVGKKTANELGLHDMSGNVWEWCSDWYGEKYYEQFRYKPAQNPHGPEKGESAVLRGGAWVANDDLCRIACRDWSYRVLSTDVIGLRLARAVSEGGR